MKSMGAQTVRWPKTDQKDSTIDNGDRLLRPNEAASMLGISRGTLYNWTYQRRIPAVKLGRTLRFSRLALERFIRSHTQPARS